VAGSISTSTTQNPLIPQFNIGGLASGLDTNSIIQSLMTIAQQPQQAIMNQITVETARQSDLQTIQTQLTTLSGALATLVSPSTWTTAQQITSSDTAHITATGIGVPPGGFSVGVQQLARAQQLTQSTSLASAAADDQLTIQIGSDPSKAFNIAISQGDSLQTIAGKINTQSNAQVYASVVNGKLALSSQVTGAANTMSVTSTGSLATGLGLTQTVSARDALFTLDGGAQQSSASNVVTSIASGLSVTLMGTTSSDASITVSPPGPNTTAVESALQGFVQTYNATVDMISAKVNEQPVGGATTDEDRVKGDLSGDPSLISLLSQLRESVGDIFSNGSTNYKALSQVGLSTGAAVGTAAISQQSLQGDLTLDTTALETAMSTNFTQVKNLFTNVTNSYSSEGLVQRLNGVLGNYVGTKGILNSELTSEVTTISQLQQQKADWDVRLTDKEAALRQQYTNMETAMSQAQSEGSWLTSQVAGLSSTS
jgi:flagellar hook-associated protein 2